MKTELLKRLAQFADSFGVYVMNAFDTNGYVSFVKISDVDALRTAIGAPIDSRKAGWRTATDAMDAAFDPTVDAKKKRTRKRKPVVKQRKSAARKSKPVVAKRPRRRKVR